MFCVECGAEGPTYQGLCARDFLRKHPVVAPPEVLDIERCSSCGSFRSKSGWSKIDRELALTGLLREAIQDFRVRVRIKPSLCDSCQKQRGRYFEGVLQVRGDGRDLTSQEMRAVRTLVSARVDRAGDPAAFISRIEEVHGGLDFYLSTNALGKTLARELSESFGGSVSSSPKLFGQKQGREVYRVTSLVRLGAFHTGEVVAVHPESEEARPVRQPPKDRTAHAVVVWTQDGAFLSFLPPEASKA